MTNKLILMPHNITIMGITRKCSNLNHTHERIMTFSFSRSKSLIPKFVCPWGLFNLGMQTEPTIPECAIMSND